jgi:hypothetical protein
MKLFISHATEDKDEVARPLAERLRSLGYSVWYDEYSLKVGQSLSEEIARGRKPRRGVPPNDTPPWLNAFGKAIVARW